MIKFGYTITYVADVKAALDFFKCAFGITRRFLHESGGSDKMLIAENTELTDRLHQPR